MWLKILSFPIIYKAYRNVLQQEKSLTMLLVLKQRIHIPALENNTFSTMVTKAYFKVILIKHNIYNWIYSKL